MSRTKLMYGLALLAALTMLSVACSSALDGAPVFDAQLGQHPAGWTGGHGSDFLAKPDGCVTCHGSYEKAAEAGGISKTSCFACHPGGVTHESGYADRARHGRHGAQINPKSIPASLGPTPMAGFASCKKCHGDDYSGRGLAVSCMKCHRKAPHPGRPWTGADRIGIEGLLQVSSHYQTHVDNIAVCYECHRDGQNSRRVPTSEPAPGALPGCYNNTLCHAYDI
jgi:hypothetical protein